MNENKITPAMLAKTPPFIEDSALPLYNPELQYRVYTDSTSTQASYLMRETTQTFWPDGTPRDSDSD